MPEPKVTFDQASIVLVGSLNPTIFHPSWLLHYKLIQERDAEKAEVEVVHWEGRVTETNDHEFTSIITDRTNPNNPDEEVIIDKEEVSPDDHELIFPGAVFYWSIGYKDAPGEPRRRVSQIRFRRLPALSRHELERAVSEARQLAELFGDD